MKNLESYNLNSSINIGANIKKDKGYLFPKKSSKKKVKPIFFKPKKILKVKLTNKCLSSDISLGKQKSNEVSKKYASSLFDHSGSDLGLKFSIPIKSKRRNSLQLKDDSKICSNISAKSKNKLENNQNNKNPTFEALKKTIINLSPQDIRQTLFEYENNEITLEINKLPDDELLIKKKLNNIKKKNEFILEDKIKNIIDLTPTTLEPLKNNFIKNMGQFLKENKYRKLLNKGHVYDSLDDEEESDEEDINSFYIEPYSKFLYILDSITFFSSLIMILYFPVYLAKQKYFCDNIINKDTFLFHCVDFIYILDLVINCYRSYYDYNEVLIKKSSLIFIHYLKTWLLFDLISSIPFFTIIKINESKCLDENIYHDYRLNNNGKHSIHYNTNINNIHYLLTLIKVIKTFKVFKYNIALKKIRKIFIYFDFFYDWGNVFLYTFFFFSFLNFGASLFIFIGRNNNNNWIFLGGLEEFNFIDIYFAAIQYLIETVTTVGYGELIGRNLNEIIFQIIMLIVGTCIYSWLISFISTYVKKINEKNIKYEEKVHLLEEMKLYNPKFNDKLYDKILKLLNYRKYHEEEEGKKLLLDSLPNSLKNTLIIEMYKSYINGFFFFRNVENREFIVQVISNLKPVLGIKGDILVQEGDYFEELIFVKNGYISLEVWIDMIDPENSINNYLIEYFFTKNVKKKQLQKSNYRSSKSLFSEKTYKNDKFFNFNNNKNDIYKYNIKKLKVLDVRKNEHFGDVFMFLNKKSPFYIRVGSNKADLLFLKKLDALDISHKFPNISKAIIKKPLENSKIIKNMAFKV